MPYASVYEAVSDLYDPDDAWEEMVSAGTETSMNVAEEALGRHADSAETGLRLKDFESGTTETFTFAELADAAGEVLHFLQETTAERARVGAMLPARLELYAAVFGTIGAGRIYVPLAPVFGPDALHYRLADAGAAVLFTAPEHLDAIDPDAVPDLERVVVVGDVDRESIGHVTVEPYAALQDHPPSFDVAETHPSDVYSITYTSGTTGQPKGCPSRHGSFVRIHPYLEFVVDLRPADTYFVAASPAWSYGLGVGTLSAGMRDTAIGCYRGRFDPESLLAALEEFDATNAMVPPTGLRQLRASGVDAGAYDVDLRVLVSAGEALDGDTVEWCRDHLSARPLDAYGQTESGMSICNYAFGDWTVKPGSMGKPMPGTEVALLDDDGNRVGTGEVGEIAVERRADAAGGYWGKPSESVETFSGPWHRTDDLAKRDEDGYYWYVSRKDAVIISAGYRIGPEEVEETLLKHDAVAEAGVVGVPDETRGNVVKAFVSLSGDAEPSTELGDDIRDFAREELSKHEYPREVEFVDALPKTASGKIKRGELASQSE